MDEGQEFPSQLMKELLDNIKNLIPIIIAIVALAGFYYTTQHRLDMLESEIADLREQDKKLKRQIAKKTGK